MPNSKAPIICDNENILESHSRCWAMLVCVIVVVVVADCIYCVYRGPTKATANTSKKTNKGRMVAAVVVIVGIPVLKVVALDKRCRCRCGCGCGCDDDDDDSRSSLTLSSVEETEDNELLEDVMKRGGDSGGCRRRCRLRH